MMRCIALLLMLSLFIAQTRADDHSTTSPSTQPTETPIRQWVNDLASPDSETRDLARVNLMSLDPSQLSDLRRICLANGPLALAQVEALKDIVLQLFLQSRLIEESVDPEEPATPLDAIVRNMGFVGVRMGFGFSDGQQTGNYSAGIVIYRRIPGFAGYRMLKDGDVIRGIVEAPQLQMNNVQDFVTTVKQRQAGQVIHLKILRVGKMLTIPIKLDPRPYWAAMQDPTLEPEDDPINRRRFDAAADYWNAHFAPGIDPKLSSTANQ